MMIRGQQIIGFTGSQAGMTVKQREALQGLLRLIRDATFLHGDCIGADAQAHEIAEALHMFIILYPQNTNPEKRAWCSPKEGMVQSAMDPLARNELIAMRSHALIACPKEEEGEVIRSGTWTTVRRARKYGKPVYIIRPNGQITYELGRL